MGRKKKVVKIRPKGRELALDISKKIGAIDAEEAFAFSQWILISANSIAQCNDKLKADGKCLNGDGLSSILDKVAELVFVDAEDEKNE